jgi:hypothetical protein
MTYKTVLGLALLFSLRCFAQDTVKSAPKTLKEVIVQRQLPAVEKRLDRTVIHVDQHITNAGTTVLELMKKLPGVQVTPEGQINLNGRPGVNVWIDGKPSYLSAEDLAALLAGTPSSEVQTIEIMTNPSARYDAAGTAGIINIVRKKSQGEGFNGSLATSFGETTYPRYNGNLILNYKTRNYNLYLNESYGYNKSLFSRSVTSDIFSSGHLLAEQVSDNSDVRATRATNTTAGIDWYLDKRTTLTLSGHLSGRTDADRTNSAMNILDGSKEPTGSENFTSLEQDRPFSYTGGWQLTHTFDSTGRELSFGADYSDFRFRPGQYNSTWNYDPADSFLGRSDIFLDQSRSLHIFGARADYVHPLPGNGRFEAGLKTSRVRTVNNSTYYDRSGGQDLLDSTQSVYTINTENIDAAYVNVNRSFKKWEWQSGLRAEHTLMTGDQRFTTSTVRQDYFELFPTLFIQYAPDKQTNFDVRFGRRIDRADYHELIPFRRPLTPTLYFQGNPNLRPSLTWHGEIGWSWQNNLFLTVGYDRDKDYVRTIPYLDSNKTTMTRIPTNIQGAHSWNIDLSYNKDLTRWWSTNTTLSTYRNAFAGSTNGFPLDNSGIVSIDLTTSNRFTLTGTLAAEVDFEYESKRQFISSTFGSYSVLSFGLKQQLFAKKASLSINVNNILQSEGHYVVDRYEDLNQYSQMRFDTRAVIIAFNYRFGRGKLTKNQRRSGSEQEQQRAGN